MLNLYFHWILTRKIETFDNFFTQFSLWRRSLFEASSGFFYLSALICTWPLGSSTDSLWRPWASSNLSEAFGKLLRSPHSKWSDQGIQIRTAGWPAFFFSTTHFLHIWPWENFEWRSQYATTCRPTGRLTGLELRRRCRRCRRDVWRPLWPSRKAVSCPESWRSGQSSNVPFPRT